MRGGETNVEVLECSVEECFNVGMDVVDGATVIATRCDFMENGDCGVGASDPNTKLRLNDCTMHHNNTGLVARDPNTKVRLNDCTMHHNQRGVTAFSSAVVDLHGEDTDIHSNTTAGIVASFNGKVQIHLPSQHNTSHDNGMQDREQWGEGTITNVK